MTITASQRISHLFNGAVQLGVPQYGPDANPNAGLNAEAQTGITNTAKPLIP